MKEFWQTLKRKLGKNFEKLATSVFMPSARTWLLMALGTLMVFSLMMVASASIPYATARGMHELKYFWSQLGYMLIACGVAVCIYHLPLSVLHSYEKFIVPMYLLVVALLIATLFSPEINGSQRWLSFLGFSFQPAELAKVFMVLLVAEYAHRRSDEMRNENMIIASLRLMVWYVPVLAILYKQPDYGSIVVLVATLFTLFWVAGVRLAQFVGLFTVVAVLGGFAAWQEGYRRERILQFLNPFDDVQGGNYQLIRSLVAFARGDVAGVGYSNSVQKLAHLPEAHNDFLFAVTAEEFGFLGVLLVLLLEFIIIMAVMRISYKALHHNQLKLSYTAFGFAVLIFGHTMINAGMNLGLLPTKGLTMPFFSYGGSAMLMFVIMMALALKIDKQIPIIAKRGENHNY